MGITLNQQLLLIVALLAPLGARLVAAAPAVCPLPVRPDWRPVNLTEDAFVKNLASKSLAEYLEGLEQTGSDLSCPRSLGPGQLNVKAACQEPGGTPGAPLQYAVSFSYAVTCTVVDDMDGNGAGKRQDVELSGVVQGVLSGTPMSAEDGGDASAAAEAQAGDANVATNVIVQAMEATRSLLMGGAQG